MRNATRTMKVGCNHLAKGGSSATWKAVLCNNVEIEKQSKVKVRHC